MTLWIPPRCGGKVMEKEKSWCHCVKPDTVSQGHTGSIKHLLAIQKVLKKRPNTWSWASILRMKMENKKIKNIEKWEKEMNQLWNGFWMQEKASQEEKSQWKHNGEERGGQKGTLAASLNLIPMLLWEAHSVTHESKDSMIKLLKRLWWWPNQRYTIEDFEEQWKLTQAGMLVMDYSDMGPE